ncbi:hypothetical protein WN943_018107 [Citrus x changshan-huyou]
MVTFSFPPYVHINYCLAFVDVRENVAFFLDIRRSIPGNLRPLMTNIPASSMYSVRSGPRSRTVSVSDSPLATSSNASSELSVNNNGLCMDGCDIEDDIGSERGGRSPASVRGR